MTVSKRKEMFHRILWMKKMKAYRFVNLQLFSAIPGLLQNRKNLRRERGCLPFVRINRLGRVLNNGKSFSKISKPTKRNGAYHLHFPVIVVG